MDLSEAIGHISNGRSIPNNGFFPADNLTSELSTPILNKLPSSRLQFSQSSPQIGNSGVTETNEPSSEEDDDYDEDESEGTTRKRKREPRVLFLPQQTEELYKLFLTNKFPSSLEKKCLAQRLNLPFRKVRVWFQNTRYRINTGDKRAILMMEKAKKSQDQLRGSSSLNAHSVPAFDFSSYDPQRMNQLNQLAGAYWNATNYNAQVGNTPVTLSGAMPTVFPPFPLPYPNPADLHALQNLYPPFPNAPTQPPYGSATNGDPNFHIFGVWDPILQFWRPY